MKKILAAVIIIILAYTIFWFYKAEEAKRLVADHLDSWQQLHSGGAELHHEGLGVWGYPLAYEVVIKNPSLSSKGEHGFESKLQGDLTIGTNLWGTRFWFDRSGDVSIQGKGVTHGPYLLTGDSQLMIAMPAKHPFKAIWHPFKHFPKELYSGSLRSLWDVIKGADFKCHDVKLIKKSEPQQLLAEIDKGHIKINKKHHNAIQDVKFLIEFKGLSAEDLSNHTLHGFTEYPALSTLHFPSNSKTFVTIEGRAAFPDNLSYVSLLTLTPMHFQISNFQLLNDFGNYSFKTQFYVKEQSKKNKTAHFDLQSSYETNKEGYDHLVGEFIQRLHVHAKEESHPLLKKLLACCEEDLKKVVPHYHELGKIATNLDVTAQLPTTLWPLKDVNVTIAQADWNASPYGINSHGDVEWKTNEMEGAYTIEWRNFQQMVEDMANYYNRVLPVAQAAFGDKDLPAFRPASPQKTQEIVSYLRSISNDPKGTGADLTFTIHFKDGKGTIGNKSFAEVVQELSKMLHLQEGPAGSPKMPEESNVASVK